MYQFVYPLTPDKFVLFPGFNLYKERCYKSASRVLDGHKFSFLCNIQVYDYWDIKKVMFSFKRNYQTLLQSDYHFTFSPAVYDIHLFHILSGT